MSMFPTHEDEIQNEQFATAIEKARADFAEADRDRLSARVGELEGALRWTLPLARIYLEITRQERLKCGHKDIGHGTEHPGLWSDEVEKLANVHQALSDTPVPDYMAVVKAARLVAEGSALEVATTPLRLNNLRQALANLDRLKGK